jgi:hypothetical protein
MSMKPTEIKDLLKQRGWINVDLAAHWDISAAWLSTMINRADLRPRVYDDAFQGLPHRSEVNVVRQKRHIRKPPKPKPRLWSFAEMFPTGRLYELIDNQLGDEGTRFVVAGTRVDGDAHIVLMHMVDDDDVVQGPAFEVSREQAVAHLCDLGIDLSA